jgi:hypothetical protein
MMQQIFQQLTADDYRRIRLMHVQREAGKLKQQSEEEARRVLSRAAIEALSALASAQAETDSSAA